jgi:hypothetical protein
MSTDVSDTTLILLEEVRRYLDKNGCKDPKAAALKVVRLCYDDLILNLNDKGSRAKPKDDEVPFT